MLGLLWVTGATNGGFAVFTGAMVCAALATAWWVAGVARAKEPLRAARAGVVMVLSAAVPVLFDPHSGDVFNLPKYTLVVVGALVLAGLWAVSSVHGRSLPAWRNGLQWLVAAIVGWTAISALFSVDTRVSLLGNYGSYDGLFAAAAFGVIMMSAAEAFDAADIGPALQALAFGGGTVVAVYGLVQLPGKELKGANWDFITWHLGSFTNQIFSTFGNPNHLGGYLAMVLPAVVVLGWRARHPLWKVAAAAMAVLAVGETVQTAARGAIVAVILMAVTLAAFYLPRLWRRLALAAVALAGAVMGAVVAGAALGLVTGGTSTNTIAQRYDIWGAAARIAAARPLVGSGPDTFAIMYSRYQSADWVKALGSNYLVNGAHDIFMNIFADQGPVGLVLWVALLVWAGLRVAGAWRRLKVVTKNGESGDPVARQRALASKDHLAVTTASIVAYVVQAVFNVQQVGLSFVFWVMLGLLAAVTRQAGVPAALHPAALLAPAVHDAPGGQAAPAPRGSGDGSSRWAGNRRSWEAVDVRRYWPLALVAVLATAAVVVLAVLADEPYRADHDYWAADISIRPNPGSSAPTPIGTPYFNDMARAMSLNAWEPTYPAYEASIYTNVSEHSSSTSQTVSDLDHARQLLARADALEPRWGAYPESEAQVDFELAQLQPAEASHLLAAAATLGRAAITDSPLDADYHTLLSKVLAAEHSLAHTSGAK